jgi:hypothetical protein
LELQSTALLRKHTADRPSFETVIRGSFSGPRAFQVFAMPKGLLFIELRNLPGGIDAGVSRWAILGGMYGGALGALALGLLLRKTSSPAEREESFDMCSDEQLFEIARSRKRSFVAKDEEIRSLTVDAPGFWGRMFGDRTLAGWITLRDSCLGKLKLELHDQSSMSVAVDALPRRFGDRMQVNVELDPGARGFVAKRG